MRLGAYYLKRAGGVAPPATRPFLLLVKSQAAFRPQLQRRLRGSIKLGKPHGGVATPVVIHVKRIRVLLQAIPRRNLQARLRVQAKLGEPHGYATRKPPVRPLLVKSAVESRVAIQRKLYGQHVLRKPRGSTVVAPRPHVRGLMVKLQAVQSRVARVRIATHSVLRKPEGYATRNPPVRKLRVLLQAIPRRQLLAKLRTHSGFTQSYGGIILVPPAPPITGAQYAAGGGARVRDEFEVELTRELQEREFLAVVQAIVDSGVLDTLR